MHCLVLASLDLRACALDATSRDPSEPRELNLGKSQLKVIIDSLEQHNAGQRNTDQHSHENRKPIAKHNSFETPAASDTQSANQRPVDLQPGLLPLVATGSPESSGSTLHSFVFAIICVLQNRSCVKDVSSAFPQKPRYVRS